MIATTTERQPCCKQGCPNLTYGLFCGDCLAGKPVAGACQHKREWCDAFTIQSHFPDFYDNEAHPRQELFSQHRVCMDCHNFRTVYYDGYSPDVARSEAQSKPKHPWKGAAVVGGNTERIEV